MNPAVYPVAYQEQRPEPELEKQSLKNYVKELESELEFVKKQLSEAEKKKT